MQQNVSAPVVDWRQFGREFAQAVAARDFETLARCFHAGVHGRLLTPSALVTPASREALVGKYREWFGEAERMELEAASCDLLGTRVAVGYRLRVRRNGRWYAIAQQTYSWLEGGLVERFDLLCSGFQPEPADRRDGGAS